jgi:hypothetical protein
VNHVRVLPDVAAIDFTPAERLEVWTLVASLMHGARAADERCLAIARERDALADRLRARRYRLLDGVLEKLRALNPVRALRRAVRVAKRVKTRVWGRSTRAALVSEASK